MNSLPRHLLCISLSALASAGVFAETGPMLYWTDRGSGKVQRSKLDGSEVVDLYALPNSNLRGLAIDKEAGYLFFADNTRDRIYRSNLEGTKMEIVVSGLGFPADLALDRAKRRLYWCDQQNDRIESARYDGTDRKTVLETPAPYYLEVDSEGAELYWGDFSRGNICRAKLDGTGEETLLRGLSRVRAVKLDPSERILYFAVREAHKVQRLHLESGKVEDLYAGLDTPHGLCLDLGEKRLYWADTGTNRVSGSTGGKAISQGSFDGKEAARIVVKLEEPWDLEVVR